MSLAFAVVFLALAQAASAQANLATPLPAQVYTDFANTGLSTVTMPAGTYYLNGSSPLRINRPNVTVNFAGCHLLLDPHDKVDDQYTAIQIASVPVTSPVYTPSPTGSGPGVRTLSHVTGVITAATTTLTMDASEVASGLAGGETVIIWAGVTPTDPVEAQDFIVATVASVNAGTRVITFTAPLGVNITNYVNSAGLTAATASGLQWKIGDWGTYPSTANFSKGYGTDHGMERFTGAFVHDVTFNDLDMTMDLTSTANAPNGMFDISVMAAQNVTLNRTTVQNPQGVALHSWRSFNELVDTFTISGTGAGVVNNTDSIEAYGFAQWGGNHSIYRHISITGTDIGGFNAEVGVRDVWVNGLTFNVTFTAARVYPSPPSILGFFSTNDAIHVTDANLSATVTGGSNHPVYFTDRPFTVDGLLTFGGTSLPETFDYGYQHAVALNGLVAIGGVVYGPPISTTLDYTIVHGAGSRVITLPTGIYTAGTVQSLSNGDMRDAVDRPFGVTYTDILTAHVDPFAADKWFQIASGDSALASYLGKYFEFYLNNAGSTADGSVRFVVTYLPVSQGCTGCRYRMRFK